MSEGWRRIGEVDMAALAQARLQSLRGAAWLARIARAYEPSTQDDRGLALVWSDDPASSDEDDRVLAAPALRLEQPLALDAPFGRRPLAAAYAPLGNRIWLRRGDETANAVTLDRRSDEEIAEQLRALLGRLGADPDALELEPPADDAPDAQRTAQPEDIASPDAVERLMDVFADARVVLEAVAEGDPAAEPPRLRARRLEMSLRIALDPSERPFKPGAAPGVEVGLSPGDAASEAPCFFAAPRPAPPREDLGPAPSGLAWRADGPPALVFPALDVMSERDGAAAAAAALDAGIARCRMLLGRLERV